MLRHQVRVLQRQVARPRLNRLDRVLFAAASRAMPRSSWSSFVVRPETLLRWHRELVREEVDLPEEGAARPAAYRARSPGTRRPPRPGESTLGYQRIRGELLKLGIRISATTVRTILLRHGMNPAPRRAGPTWAEFLRSPGFRSCWAQKALGSADLSTDEAQKWVRGAHQHRYYGDAHIVLTR